MITVNGLTKRYARTVAVDHISFEVQKGQIVGFLGPNGAGKTTTMRILTCFLPPSEGSATVAGFDVLEHPMEVKKRIGYLPETPPLYPEMESARIPDLRRQIEGLVRIRAAHARRGGFRALRRRRCFQQTAGQAFQRLPAARRTRPSHHPQPRGPDSRRAHRRSRSQADQRDPRSDQGLAGDHTIILSTHILPEVEQTCERVIIINKGKLVATDSVHNLQARARGVESILLEVEGRNGVLDVRHPASSGKASGVSRVVPKEAHQDRFVFEVESLKDRLIRGDLARAVVEAGWNLNELRPSAMSLEEIFLQLTGTEAAVPPPSRRPKKWSSKEGTNEEYLDHLP